MDEYAKIIIEALLLMGEVELDYEIVSRVSTTAADIIQHLTEVNEEQRQLINETTETIRNITDHMIKRNTI